MQQKHIFSAVLHAPSSSQALHRQRDALFLRIYTEDLDPDDVPDLEHFPRVADEAVADLGNMHQAVLMNAQVHKSAEVDDVAHGAREFHTGLEVLQTHDIAAQQGLGQAVAHVAAGLAQFRNDVVQRGRADAQRFTQRAFPPRLDGGGQAGHALGADLGRGIAAGIQQGFGGGVTFGVDGSGVQTVLGFRQAQEARALFKRLGAQPLDLFELGAGSERTLLLAPGHDVLGPWRR